MNNYLFKSQIDIVFSHLTSGKHPLGESSNANLNVVIMNGAKEARVEIKGTGETLLLPPYSLFLVGKDSNVKITIPDESTAIALFFDYVGKYCDEKICSYLESKRPQFSNTYSTLLMNEALRGYFITMNNALVDIFDEIPFKEIKYKEFFYILCKWLEVSNFAEFVHPAMSWYDPVFRRKVMDNYERSYRVKTLAADCGYNMKEFVEKFKIEFDTLPGLWINDQIHKAMLKKLSNTSISFQEIANDLQMSSVQSLSRFCRRNFGKTPGMIRKELASKG